MAGFSSAEAYEAGADYPYKHVQRYFVRQTVDFSGDTQKVDADINQFAGSQTANRLLLALDKFSIVDIAPRPGSRGTGRTQRRRRSCRCTLSTAGSSSATPRKGKLRDGA